jgi:hypothetical protein
MNLIFLLEVSIVEETGNTDQRKKHYAGNRAGKKEQVLDY